MKGGRTREELEAIVREELAELGLVPDRIELRVDDMFPWWLTIEIAGRRFSLGQMRHDGFFCEEITESQKANFIAGADEPVLGGEDRLRREGLRLVRYAVEHPEFRGVVRPVI